MAADIKNASTLGSDGKQLAASVKREMEKIAATPGVDLNCSGLATIGDLRVNKATAGTAGVVSVYLQVNVNGTEYKIPLHLL